MLPADVVNPVLSRLEVPCRPFGLAVVLVLILPRAAASLLGAFWAPPWGALYQVRIGRA